MNIEDKRFLKKWEIALLMAICIALFSGMWARREQNELAGKLIRLHVLAVSDDKEQQELKLAVRDRILEILQPVIDDADGRDQAEDYLLRSLPELEAAAAQVAAERGQECGVAAELCIESYPTRRYGGFSLPAGDYLSLKLVLGPGEGKNWWCVVFPPLCFEAAEGITSAVNGLSEDDVSLITEDGGGYVVKFKILELWGKLASQFKSER